VKLNIVYPRVCITCAVLCSSLGWGKLYHKIFYICHGLEQYVSTLMVPNLHTESH